MAAKRASSSGGGSGGPTPLVNALVVLVALAYGAWLMTTKGWMTWPPSGLLAAAFTISGCLALVGPIVLFRREAGDGGLGELLWLTGGILIWVFDIAAALRGEANGIAWATPLGARAMGLTILAVLLAAWRTHGDSRSWAWTNVTGWILGLFWVGLALGTLVPGAPMQLALR